jgi:hypothetical protein
MCFACDWANYLTIHKSDETVSQQDLPSRRRVLQASAVLGVATVAPILEATAVSAQTAQPT